MALWDDVKKEFKKAVEDGWSAVRTEAKSGQLRFKAHGLHKEAEKVFADLGAVIYDLAKPPFDNPYPNPEVTRLIEEIRRIEAEAFALEDAAEEAKKKAAATQTSVGAKPAEAKEPAKKPATKRATKKD